MGISKVLSNIAMNLFKKPSSCKNMSLAQNIIFGGGLGYSTVKVAQEANNLFNNKDVNKENLMSAETGFAVAAGSIFGVGGAVLAGIGTEYLIQQCKDRVAN